MLLQIEKKGSHWVITNNPPIKYKKFTVQIDENDIVELNISKPNQNIFAENNKELLEMRKKYPQLYAIDQITSNWMISSSDDELLEEYFKHRAEDEGIF